MSKILGSSFLIAGCAIGAGMLGLPVISYSYGFIPSLIVLLLACSLMTMSGILLADQVIEAKRTSQNTSLLMLAENSFGKSGKIFIGTMYSLLFYTVLVAFFLGGMQLLQSMGFLIGIKIPDALALIIFVTPFYGIFLKTTHVIDKVNRVFMIGLLLSYLGLLKTAYPACQREAFYQAQWNGALTILPVFVFSFGFHNLIPTITDYLDGDRKAIKRSLLLGSALALLIYILWEGCVLGVLYEKNFDPNAYCTSGAMVTTLLVHHLGSSSLVHFANAFAFFALVTSVVAVGMSFRDFIQDGIRVKKTSAVVLSMLPAFVIALSFPEYFLLALGFAGGLFAMILFGLFPVALYFFSKKKTRKGILLASAVGVLATIVMYIELFNR